MQAKFEKGRNLYLTIKIILKFPGETLQGELPNAFPSIKREQVPNH